MNVLLINIHFHAKNLNAFMKYGFNVTIIYHTNLNEMDLSKFDFVYSPSIPIQVSLYPNTKFIFGPHFSVFPIERHTNMIKGPNSIYIQPSEWAAKCWTDYYQYPHTIKINPFGVDTDHFKEIQQDKSLVFVYYKRRDPAELKLLQYFLKYKNINYKIFSYTDRYDEQEYLQYLQQSKYGIVLDAHESQGFAIEEALSCNVPLLVWSATSMKQEYQSTYHDIACTSVPYWDNRCGEVFYDKKELEKTFDFFIYKLKTYTPRQYILDHLSIEKCKEKFIQLCI